MSSNLSLLDSLNFIIEYYREILNSLLLYFEPTNQVVVKVSQQLDKCLNDYNNIIINNNCKYIT